VPAADPFASLRKAPLASPALLHRKEDGSKSQTLGASPAEPGDFLLIINHGLHGFSRMDKEKLVDGAA
jgi:hypothetical protein